jgi:uncharacterized membrane protein
MARKRFFGRSRARAKAEDLTPARTVCELTQRNVDVVAKMQKAADEGRSFGERMADKFAAVVGSWTFLIAQTVVLAIWIVLNVIAWAYKWDPYPFILLNLMLSFQAAYATPIIIMSQNRQAKINERRNHLDLQINLLAEQESTEMLRLLRLLCEKQGIRIQGPALQALAESTEPEEVLRQIEKTVEGRPPGAPAGQKNGPPAPNEAAKKKAGP